ncbi:hypothetical protein ACFX13_007300 [Malus domestica]
MFQSDGGGEYTSHQFKHFFLHHGIHHRLSCPHHPEQNGLAERKHRHIVDTGLTLMAHASMPPAYWAEAMHTVVYLLNRLPSKVLGFMSPYQKLFLKEPDYSFLKTFGCACFPYLRPYNNNKLQFRSTKCVFLGYSLNHQGYRCLDISTNRIFLSRHVVFDEGNFPFKAISGSLAPSSPASSPPPVLEITGPLTRAPRLSSSQPVVVSPSLETHQSRPSSDPPQPALQVYSRDPHRRVLSFAQAATPSAVHSDAPPEAPSAAVPPAVPSPSHGMLTRSKTASLKPPKYVFSAAISSTGPIEPTCFSQANTFPEWRTAMANEFNALQRAGTWTLVPRTASMNILPNKWVFRIKQNSDGSIQRYKARLVANGFHQQPGLDYGETFSPVVNHSTIRLILALSVQFQWPVRQLDVQNAFLHGSLSEEVYMHQPRGFVDPQFPHHVCRLRRSLYGLKQAPRAWFQCFSTHLEDLGFRPSTADHSLFTYIHGSTRIYLLIYVDDILVTGNNPSHIVTLIKNLGIRFSMKDLGPVHYFLGMEVVRTPSGLSLSQQKYATDLLHRTKMHGAKPVPTPAVSGRRLSLQDGDPLPDPTEYRSVVGALQYLTLTRPDINFAVNQVCQFLHQPTSTHWAAVKRILRYLVGTTSHGLIYKPGSFRLTAFSDADYAGDPDDRRSTGGYCLYLGSNLVSWSAKKQNGVSRSSTEAEYRQLAITAATLSWFRMLFRDLQFPLHCHTLFCDNISAISLASNPVFHARTRHVEVDYHYVREKVVRKELDVRYLSTHDQIADIFTKGLSLPRFRLLVSKLPVLDFTVSLRGRKG